MELGQGVSVGKTLSMRFLLIMNKKMNVKWLLYNQRVQGGVVQSESSLHFLSSNWLVTWNSGSFYFFQAIKQFREIVTFFKTIPTHWRTQALTQDVCLLHTDVCGGNIKLRLCTGRDLSRVFTSHKNEIWSYCIQQKAAPPSQGRWRPTSCVMSDSCPAGVMLLWPHVLSKSISSSASASAGIHLDTYCHFVFFCF